MSAKMHNSTKQQQKKYDDYKNWILEVSRNIGKIVPGKMALDVPIFVYCIRWLITLYLR